MPGSRIPLLEVEALSKTFGGLRAVDRLTFAVGEGEIVGLLGPNGSGKTTTFNLVAGALRPDGGEIRFAGRRITRSAPSLRAHLGIARTFQLVRMFPNLTVLENVLVGRLYGRDRVASPVQARTEALALLGLVGVEQKHDVLAVNLTLGERKRLEIARALAARPRLLLLDEPAAGLTPREVDAAVALFRRIRAQGTAIALVEHNVRAVRALCDRVVVLHAGKQIAQGTPAEVFAHAAVVQAYLGRR
ncbi:MAG TPA: ABC transporter ATP-binding protein [bacterium]|nr:ABC transporter ATP-binding protein [bacterium]